MHFAHLRIHVFIHGSKNVIPIRMVPTMMMMSRRLKEKIKVGNRMSNEGR